VYAGGTVCMLVVKYTSGTVCQLYSMIADDTGTVCMLVVVQYTVDTVHGLYSIKLVVRYMYKLSRKGNLFN